MNKHPVTPADRCSQKSVLRIIILPCRERQSHHDWVALKSSEISFLLLKSFGESAAMILR
jgi:hypothetical protein